MTVQRASKAPTVTRRGAAPKVTLSLEEKLNLTLEEAAALLNVGRDRIIDLTQKLDPATNKPMLRSVKIGSWRYIPRKCLEQFMDWLIERGEC